MIDSAIKSGSGTYIFYNSTVVEPGAKATKVKEIIDNTVIPNALVLPIKAGQTAKTGDIVLTWWQSGSGLQRAYVVEGGKTPKVAYLDGKSLGTDTLKADSFNVLSADWQQGTTVACKNRDTEKYEQFTLINSAGDMVLISGWAGSLTTMTKSRCVPVPFKTDVKVGDTVYVAPYGSFSKATVSSVDAANGKIKAKYEFASSTTEEEFSFGSVLTAMPK
jgi:co-chaperonin GroES (HSP10)